MTLTSSLVAGSVAAGVFLWAAGAVVLTAIRPRLAAHVKAAKVGVRMAITYGVVAAITPPIVGALGRNLGVTGTHEHLQVTVVATATAGVLDAVVMANPSLRSLVYGTSGDVVSVRQCAVLLWALSCAMISGAML